MALGVPGDPPRVFPRVGRAVEEHDHAVEVPAARREDLDVAAPRVPVAERLPDIEAVLQARREFSTKVVAEGLQGVVFDVRPEPLDGYVLRRPAALPERVP